MTRTTNYDLIVVEGSDKVNLLTQINTNTETIDEVKRQIDMYFTKSGDYVDINSSKGYRELIGYALKDSIVKV